MVFNELQLGAEHSLNEVSETILAVMRVLTINFSKLGLNLHPLHYKAPLKTQLDDYCAQKSRWVLGLDRRAAAAFLGAHVHSVTLLEAFWYQMILQSGASFLRPKVLQEIDI